MKTVYTPEFQARVLADLRAGEKAYPIYVIHAEWSEEYPPGAEDRMVRPGRPPLPENRFWNSTGWDKLAREDEDPEAIVKHLRETWWPDYSLKRLQPADLTITVTLRGRDVWCAGWFSHYTWDVGMSDIEVIESLSRYVDRIFYGVDDESLRGGMLMSAEDRWRWHGCVDGNPQGERTDPPCRCEGCKKGGIVRIDH